ncbi:MAG: MFS transporter [Candidatus Competibacterales bacterium]
MSSDAPRAPAAFPLLILVSGCLIVLLSFGVRSTFGLFLDPMVVDLGVALTPLAFALALQNLLWGAAQPFAGMLADRHGAAWVIVGGGVLYTLGVGLAAYTDGVVSFTLGAGILVGVGLAGTGFAVVLAALSRAVPPESRSWALGLGTAAGSLGQFLIAPLGALLLAGYGWAGALGLLALGAGLMVPLGLMLGNSKAPTVPGEAPQSPGAALIEAYRHPGYRYLTLGFFVCGFHVAFIGVHLPVFLASEGLGGGLAAWAIALIGLFNIIGSYSAGVLGGRMSKRYLLSTIYAARAVVIALYVTLPITPASTLVFAACMGILWLSTVPPTSGIVAQVFGVRHMAMLFGIVFFSHQVGSFLGVWLGGYLYDLTGSFQGVWWIGVALGIASAIIHLPIDERPVARLPRVQGAGVAP